MVNQTNFVIKDIPGDWIEVIYISGITVAHAGQTGLTITTKHGGRVKAYSLSLGFTQNTPNLNAKLVQTSGAQITYGTILDAATGLFFVVNNFDAAVDETNCQFCIILYGG